MDTGHDQDPVYLDNAASSWPKPAPVITAMERVMREASANPGRSAHRMSIEAARVIADARLEVAALFGIHDPLRVVFTKNATESLNIVIRGLLRPGDHVIVSSMEHNSVMRPLTMASRYGVVVEAVRCFGDGTLDPDEVRRAIRKSTRLVLHTHASNVSGAVMPAAAIGLVAREHGVYHCVDAAQSAGCLPIDVDAMNIDFLCFTGHKALYGPQGTGGLYVREGLEGELDPLMTGGTGSLSEREEQPAFMPDKYESGTPNTVGIAGLLEGVRFVRRTGVDAIRVHEMRLAEALMDGMSSLRGVRIVGPRDRENRIAVVSVTVEDADPSELAFMLDDVHGVMTRPGLQCAPSAHRTLGTFPAGTLRFSPGFFTTEDQIDRAVRAMAAVAGKP